MFAYTSALILPIFLAFVLAVSPAHAAEPVNTCGMVLSDGGFLVSDLDCSGYVGGPAVTIAGGTLDLGGFTFTTNTPADDPQVFPDAAIICPRRCKIVGP